MSVLTVWACGGKDTVGPGTGNGTPTVATVVLTPGNAILASLGETVQLTASAQDASGNAVSGKTFTWSSSASNVATVDASSGVATARANGTTTITATTDGVSGLASLTVEIVVAQLLFVSQTSSGTAGFGLGDFLVQPLDGGGSVIRTATDAVTMSLGNNPGMATLMGTLTVNAVDGMARFSDVAISEPGIGYTLIATSGSAVGESRPIAIRPTSCPSGLAPAIVHGATPLPAMTDGVSGSSSRTHLTWTAQSSGTTQTLWSTWGSSSTDVFAVASDGSIVFYDGASWRAQASGTTQILLAVWGSSATDVFAAGGSGTILHRDDTSWREQASGGVTGHGITGLWGSSSTDVFAVARGAADSRILHYDGGEWTQTTITVCDHMAVWGSSPTDVFVVTTNGVILHYDGASWSPQITGTDRSLTSIWGSSSTDVFAVGENGIILHYNGTSWSPQASGVNDGLEGVSGSSPTDVFAVGRNGLILHYDGVDWTVESRVGSQTLWAVYVASQTAVFAVGDAGLVVHGTL